MSLDNLNPKVSTFGLLRSSIDQKQNATISHENEAGVVDLKAGLHKKHPSLGYTSLKDRARLRDLIKNIQNNHMKTAKTIGA